FYFSFFIFLVPFSIYALDKTNEDDKYALLIQIYQEWLSLDNKTFQMRSFNISPTQILKGGTSQKLTLQDNFGQKWIFKPFDVYENIPNAIDLIDYDFYTFRTVAIRRIYKLFGIDTAPIYPIVLTINNKKIKGSIQKFLPNKGVLTKRHAYEISQEALNYILKAHAIDWLFGNYDAKYDHFLIISMDKDNIPNKIVRVDNKSSLGRKHGTELTQDWTCNKNAKSCNRYYFHMWKNYISGNINLNLMKNLKFIEYISNFPDDIFEKIILFDNISKIKNCSLDYFDKIKKQNFQLPLLNLKKKTLIENFKKFYINLANKRGLDLKIKNDIDYEEITSSICTGLLNEIDEFNNEIIVLKTVAQKQPKIDAIFSVEGFELLREILRIHKDKKEKDLISAAMAALKTLEGIKKQSNNENEIIALDRYMDEIERIQLGNPPSIKYQEINNFIKSVVK
ncbi:MAG: hypothetical protein KAJ14_06190, partial [Candidatus Omnitrophica bacterium]|nr:hypothetical protein [Candidatus Omnitrophota bacterium]